MSNSQKLADFISGKMKNDPVEAIAGVGDNSKAALNAKNITYAYQLLGEFLLLGRNRQVFDDWLQYNVPSMNSAHRSYCVECLSEWCRKNF